MKSILVCITSLCAIVLIFTTQEKNDLKKELNVVEKNFEKEKFELENPRTETFHRMKHVGKSVEIRGFTGFLTWYNVSHESDGVEAFKKVNSKPCRISGILTVQIPHDATAFHLKGDVTDKTFFLGFK